MTKIRGSLDIASPVELVFDTVADQRNEPRYNPQMTDSVMLTEGPIGVGTRFRTTVLTGRRSMPVEIECTAFDRPHRIASRSVMGSAVVEGQVQCDPIPDGTRFSWEWELSLAGPARFAGPQVELIGRRQERRIWTGLKRLLEEGVT